MIYVMITVFLFTLDSVIKHKIEKNTESGVIKELLNKRVVIRKYHNTGAMLEAFSKKQQAVAITSLTVASFISGIFVAILGTKGRAMLKTGLALIMGGAFSNTYDRLSKKYVVDYLSFKVKSKNKVLKKIEKVIFNISDFAIFIGSVFLILDEIINAE